MRTQGSFKDVYEAAKDYCVGYLKEYDEVQPTNPVIRCEGGVWILESGLHAKGSDNTFECSLEAFDNWFYESYKDDSFEITDEIVEKFLAAFEEK